MKQSDSEALRWFKRAAELGDEDSWTILADYYSEGKGCEKNILETIRWNKKIIDEGTYNNRKIVAANNLGLLYQQGDGVEKNNSEAIEWYKIAAQFEDGTAECAIGSLLIENEQFQEAIGWLKRSVAHGFEPARELLKTIESALNELQYLLSKNKGE